MIVSYSKESVTNLQRAGTTSAKKIIRNFCFIKSIPGDIKRGQINPTIYLFKQTTE
jgi:hypothetical protein